MHKKIGLQKALLTFPSYVLLTNELHPLPDETTILGEALFSINVPSHFALYIKVRGTSMVFYLFFQFSLFPLSGSKPLYMNGKIGHFLIADGFIVFLHNKCPHLFRA